MTAPIQVGGTDTGHLHVDNVDDIDGKVEVGADRRKRTWRSYLLLHLLILLTLVLLGMGSVASAGAPRMTASYQYQYQLSANTSTSTSATNPQSHAPQTGVGGVSSVASIS